MASNSTYTDSSIDSGRFTSGEMTSTTTGSTETIKDQVLLTVTREVPKSATIAMPELPQVTGGGETVRAEAVTVPTSSSSGANPTQAMQSAVVRESTVASTYGSGAVQSSDNFTAGSTHESAAPKLHHMA